MQECGRRRRGVMLAIGRGRLSCYTLGGMGDARARTEESGQTLGIDQFQQCALVVASQHLRRAQHRHTERGPYVQSVGLTYRAW
eukprot:1121185-Prorocentrum_minimum.AAC.1